MTISSKTKAAAAKMKSEGVTTRTGIIDFINNSPEIVAYNTKITTYYAMLKLLDIRSVGDELPFIKAWIRARDDEQIARDNSREMETFDFDMYTKLIDESLFTTQTNENASTFVARRLIYLAAVSGRRPAEIMGSRFEMQGGDVVFQPLKKRASSKFEILRLESIKPSVFIQRLGVFRTFVDHVFGEDQTRRVSAQRTALRIMQNEFDKKLSFQKLRSLYTRYAIKVNRIPVERHAFARRVLLNHSGNNLLLSASDRYGFTNFPDEKGEEEVPKGKVRCECGRVVIKHTIKKHRNTKVHKKLVDARTEPSFDNQ